MPKLEIRYAESADDAKMIHQFLILVAYPQMHCPLNFMKSWTEVHRVVTEEIGLMAFLDGEFVGTLGLMTVPWWYGDGEFMTDRWFFTFPALANRGIGATLLAEAAVIGLSANLPLIIHGKTKKRALQAGGIEFVRPFVVLPGQKVDFSTAERQLSM